MPSASSTQAGGVARRSEQPSTLPQTSNRRATQRIWPVVAFEIVLGPEEPWPPVDVGHGCPERVEPARDRAENRFSAFTSVAIGRNSGGCAWLVRLVWPRPWIAASAFHPGSKR